MKLNGKPRRPWRLVVIALIPIFFVLASMKPTNHEATRPNHDDPLLRTRHYHGSLQQVRQIITATIPTLRTYGQRWQLASHPKNEPSDSKNEDVVQAIVPVLIFKDDLTVTLRSEGQDTTVDVASAARVGKGDFGENRRHILQLLAALDGKLSHDP